MCIYIYIYTSTYKHDCDSDYEQKNSAKKEIDDCAKSIEEVPFGMESHHSSESSEHRSSIQANARRVNSRRHKGCKSQLDYTDVLLHAVQKICWLSDLSETVFHGKVYMDTSHVCVYICIYVCVDICICIYIYIHVFICIYMYSYVFICIYMYFLRDHGTPGRLSIDHFLKFSDKL